MHLTRLICLALACAALPVGAPPARADFIPNDPYFQPYQWALQKMNVPQAWDLSFGSPNIKIGIVDTGIIPATPELQGHLLPAINVFGTSEGISPDPHGTWVASTIGMTINNGIAGAGIGNFALLPIRATFPGGQTNDQLIEQGIALAVQNDCRVITISLPATNYGSINTFVGQTLAARLSAGGKDFLVFMAAGNSNTLRTLGSPDLDNAQLRLASDHLIMVAGTDENDQRWATDTFTGSDLGPFVDLAAPAHNVLVANGVDPSLPYAFASGTSFSSPFAASAAAMAFSINPDLTADQVKDMLLDTAFNPDNPSPGTPFYDQTYGWGRVDFGALANAASTTAVPEASSLWMLGFGTCGLLVRRRQSAR